jgi:hypothetical protein
MCRLSGRRSRTCRPSCPPTASRGLSFGDEAAAINRSSALLQRLAVKTQVVVIHQGDSTVGANGPNDCNLAANGPIDAVLEQQWLPNGGQTRILQPSSTLHYTQTLANPIGNRVSNITINGVPVYPAASYRVTVNNFLAAGGDSFSVLTRGTSPAGRSTWTRSPRT